MKAPTLNQVLYVQGKGVSSHLTYVKLGTTGRWVGTQTGADVLPPDEYDKAFLVTAHSSMGIGSSI